MMLRTVKCDVPGCDNQITEANHGDGWPRWGLIQGRQDTDTGQDVFYVCPKHLDQVFLMLLGDQDNGMDKS